MSNSEESHINLLPFLSYTVLKEGEGKRKEKKEEDRKERREKTKKES